MYKNNRGNDKKLNFFLPFKVTPSPLDAVSVFKLHFVPAIQRQIKTGATLVRCSPKCMFCFIRYSGHYLLDPIDSSTVWQRRTLSSAKKKKEKKRKIWRGGHFCPCTNLSAFPFPLRILFKKSPFRLGLNGLYGQIPGSASITSHSCHSSPFLGFLTTVSNVSPPTMDLGERSSSQIQVAIEEKEEFSYIEGKDYLCTTRPHPGETNRRPWHG